METAPHPQPLYWISIGRRLARSGQWEMVDPADYGRVFADDDPPEEWVYAVRLGQQQEIEHFISEPARVEPPSVKANWPKRTLAWLLRDI